MVSTATKPSPNPGKLKHDAYIIMFAVLLITSTNNAHAQNSASRFEIVGDPVINGSFDLSIEYGEDGTGWLAYSRVRVPEYVSTHLAKSADLGKTWKFVSAVNPSVPGELTVDGEVVQGVWRYETSAITYDPKDTPTRRWKLFVHRYLSTPPHQTANYSLGWTEVKYAKTPNGPWSEAERLFGKKAYGAKIDINDLDPSLAKFSYYNEVGAVVFDDVIYLSFDASTTPGGLGDWENRKVILIASADHGASWKYVGTLTDYKDADSFGYHVFTATSLVAVDGKAYLLASPSGKKGIFVKNRNHDGTYVLPFEDIRSAKLMRDADGKLFVKQRVNPAIDAGGQGDYDKQNINGGMVFSGLSLENPPEFFQSFNSGKPLF